MLRRLGMTLLILALFAAEILRVYFIMPFPGSQTHQHLDIAYWLHRNIWWIRVLGGLALLFTVVQTFRKRHWLLKTGIVIVSILYLFLFYLFNFKFTADHIFYQPKHKLLADASSNKVDERSLVIGVMLHGESHAYPIRQMGFHHQVQDTIGGEPVMVTYCTVCRTGRVFSPMVKGKHEKFRLVGMDHFNAMFEDAGTGSWWRQVSGEAVEGPLKGQVLTEIPCQQMTLHEWFRMHPGSLVLQPDPTYAKHFQSLADYEAGDTTGGLEGTDRASWKDHSWVLGVQVNQTAKAYDWNMMRKNMLTEDVVGGKALAIVVLPDQVNYFVWDASPGDRPDLHFTLVRDSAVMHEQESGTTWSLTGECLSGKWKGQQLDPVQASQEFWLSWKTFHPKTQVYKP